MLQDEEKKLATEGQEEAPLTQQQRRDGPADTQNSPAQTNTLSSESSFGCDASLWFCCNDGSEPNTPSRLLQAVAQREHFLLPQPDAPSGAPSRERLESLGWIFPQQAQHFLFFLSPGNLPSSKTMELTVLLQQTTKLHSLKASSDL